MSSPVPNSLDLRLTIPARFPGKESPSSNPLAAKLAQEMALRWEKGERPLAEEFLQRHPNLLQQPGAVLQLICEEICLRQEYGESISLSHYLSRFPHFQEQLNVLVGCHRLFDQDTPDSPFPQAGEEIGEYFLMSELGRGLQSRVFLAFQHSLSDRPVVVKVVPRENNEHLNLARLQHTNIVPLYSAHTDPEKALLLLCMPYFGSKTFSHLFDQLKEIPIQQRTGRDLLAALDNEDSLHPDLPRKGTARKFLSRLNYVSAICWLVATLAEAIHYAHERNLIHLDLKPSNLLLTVEAQPMLLDFHLAQSPIDPQMEKPSRLGGTPGYMSPEQKQAVADLQQGRDLSVRVDGRSDIYSLGVVLCQAFGMEVPAKEPISVPSPTSQISVGLADIVRQCLAEDPKDRYGSAADLAEDLRRHLQDLPLRTAPNRSAKERWRKWQRRNPLVIGRLLFSLAIFVVLAFGLVQFLRGLNHRDPNPPRDSLAEVKPIESGTDKFRFLFQQGTKSLQDRQEKAATQSFSQCIPIAPEKYLAECYALRGQAYLLLGEYSKARSDFDQTLLRKPNNWSALMNRGVAYYQQKNYKLALRDLKKAHSLNANNNAIRFNLALVFQAKEEKQMALAYLNEILISDPHQAKARRLLGQLEPGFLQATSE